ncbi:hypothetical protein WICMUC_001691 [Wickerhamomyces mucosus]|uniref:Methyltransferase type 12 domain-containing protein n=1 Tax=Wickerhamomyces mucosus TaxID=1378264 RepID=A0A9P8PU10_9ASCO|nr:hypothetical protein WICMUC_001691 [Wickerhamomyces mucosus]
MGLKKFIKSFFKPKVDETSKSVENVKSTITSSTTSPLKTKSEDSINKETKDSTVNDTTINDSSIPVEEAQESNNQETKDTTETKIKIESDDDFEEIESEEIDTRIGRDDPFVFGQRKLENEDDVWNHNAWDNVELTEDQIKELEEKIAKQHDDPVKDFDKKLVNENPAKYWDLFYKNNRENFFKDRKWLQIEFPSLYEATKKDAGPKTILEIGCGAGNTLFPILNQNSNEQLRIHGSDYSKRAVELVKTSEHFNDKYASASVWDLANSEGELPEGIEPNSVDIAVMIFVFSALSPIEWDNALNNLSKVLKPGGQILFRDYGRYDLAQVRFKKHRLLEDNFYIRGDNTRVYFFTEEELRNIFTQKFIEKKIGSDKRLIVNRKRQVKMYRIWLQAVFEVPKLEDQSKENGKKVQESINEAESEVLIEETKVQEPIEDGIKVEDTSIVEEIKVEETPVEEVVEEGEVEETKVEEPAVKEPAVEEPAVEGPAVEETKAEEPVTEEIKSEQPVLEETKTEEPETKAEEPETKAEEPEIKAEEPVVEEIKSEEPETKAEEPAVEETKIEEPETKTEEPVLEEIKTEEPEIKAEEPVLEETKSEEPVLEETKAEETKAEETPAEETKEQESSTEETKDQETKESSPETEQENKPTAKISTSNSNKNKNKKKKNKKKGKK